MTNYYQSPALAVQAQKSGYNKIGIRRHFVAYGYSNINELDVIYIVRCLYITNYAK